MNVYIFKKIRLISKPGFLASSLLNIEAMEKNKNNIIIENNEATIRNIKRIDNNFENVKECKEIRLKDISQLMTLEQLTNFLNKYKKDIIAPVHQGDEARKNAYNEAKIVHNCFINLIKKIIIKENFDINSIFSKKTTERNEMIDDIYNRFISDLEESEIKQIIPEEITKKYPLTKHDLYRFGEINNGVLYRTFIKIKRFRDLNKNTTSSMENILNGINIDPWARYDYIKNKIKEEKNILKYLCIKTTEKSEETAKKIEENWHYIGRGILHHDYWSQDRRVFKKQLDNCKNGVINCTVWAEIIWWFLNSNGYPAKLIDYSEHRLLEVPIRENKNIKLKTIEVYEYTNSLDEIIFIIRNVNRENTGEEIWKSLQDAEYDLENSDANFTSPTFRYFGPLLTYMEWAFCYDFNIINGFFLELKSIFKNFETSKDIEYDLENGIIKYSLNILPSKSAYGIRRVYIPLNLNDIYLSENKYEKGGTVFRNIKKSKICKETEFLYTAFSMENSIYKVRIDDTNKLFIFQSSDDNLYGQLYSKELPNYIIKLPIFRIHKYNTKYYKPNKNDAIFFNYPNYRKNITIDIKNPIWTLDNIFLGKRYYEEKK